MDRSPPLRSWLPHLLRVALLVCAVVAMSCASQDIAEHAAAPPQGYQSASYALSTISCDESADTGYTAGTPFPIVVVTVDGKPAERETANAYYVMAEAAAADGVNIQVVSGFRTMAEQQALYDCYVNCSCNNCNLAATPGYSNHQSGHAMDLNTGAPGVLGWLNTHGSSYGFSRTVPSEDWHWEWWGGGPGGGPCAAEVIVDNADPGFSWVQGGGSALLLPGGYEGDFYSHLAYSVNSEYTIGRWTPEIPSTGLYAVDVYVPSSAGSTSTEAAIDVSFQGGHVIDYVDFSGNDDDWVEVLGGTPLKFVEGTVNNVTLTNLSAEGPTTQLAWDAVRWRFVGEPGGAPAGSGCTLSSECGGSLICVADTCASPCSAASCGDSECDPATGACVDEEGADDGGSTPGGLGSGDTDQDGIPDNVEGDDDADGDFMPNWLDDDSDGDGIPDADEAGDDPTSPTDTDEDGTPDYLDEDSDGDGIPDADEAGSDPDDPTDTDGDGTPDFQDEDSDNDGIPDADEVGDDPSDPIDTDGDGTPDYLDEDSDGDGIPDSEDDTLGDDDDIDMPLPGSLELLDRSGRQGWGNGCACDSTGSPAAPWGVLLLPLFLRRRSRR